MATPTQFAKKMNRISVQIEGNVSKGMRKIALAIDSALVTSTPVDTGRARSNWIAGIDAPATGTRGATDPGTAVARAAGEMSSFNIKRNAAIHLTNNLPYIGALDEGSSAQAPAGFVRRAILAGIGAVKSVKLLRK